MNIPGLCIARASKRATRQTASAHRAKHQTKVSSIIQFLPFLEWLRTEPVLKADSVSFWGKPCFC